MNDSVTLKPHSARVSARPLVALLASAVFTGPAARLSAQAAPEPAWRLVLGLEGAYDSNPAFAGEAAEGDVSSRLSAALERLWSAPRGRFRLRAGGQRQQYRALTRLDRNNFALEAAGTARASRRLAWGFSAGFRSDSSRDLGLLLEGGLLLPQARARSLRGRGDLAWRQSARDTLVAEVSYDRVVFDAAGLRGGTSLGARAALTHAFAGGSALNFGLEHRRQGGEASSGGAIARIGAQQTASAAWTRPLGQGFEATLTASLSRFTFAQEPSDVRFAATGGAGLRARRGRHTLSAEYLRQAGQAFGFSRSSLSNAVSLSEDWRLTRRASLEARAGWRRITAPDDPGFELVTLRASTRLSYALSRRLAATLTGALARGREPGRADVDSRGVVLALVYERGLR